MSTTTRLTPQRRAEIERDWGCSPDASHNSGMWSREFRELLREIDALGRDLTAERAARERADVRIRRQSEAMGYAKEVMADVLDVIDQQPGKAIHPRGELADGLRMALSELLQCQAAGLAPPAAAEEPAPKQGTITEAFEALRAAGGSDWDNIADPAAFLGRDESPAPAGRDAAGGGAGEP